MRKVLLTAAALVLAGLSSIAIGAPADKAETVQQEEVKWLTNFAQAHEIAKKENKVLFVDFSGSDWCGWCIKLHKEVLSQKAFLDYAKDNLVLVLIDFPRRKAQSPEEKRQNAALARQFNVRGYPTVLLISPEGKILAKTGYRRGGARAYVQYLKGVLKR